MYFQIHSDFIHNSCNVEVTQGSSNRWINKVCCKHAVECYSNSKKKKLLRHVSAYVNLEDTNWNNPARKTQIHLLQSQGSQIPKDIKQNDRCRAGDRNENVEWSFDSNETQFWKMKSFAGLHNNVNRLNIGNICP